MFLHPGFINYYTTSEVFFFIDDSRFSDVVQCIKSKRLTLSDGLTVGLEKHMGQRKQPMCSNAVSLFSVIAIIICQHPEVGCMLCFGILKNVLRKAWHTTSFLGQKYINHRLKGWVIKYEKGGQTRTKKEFKKRMKVILIPVLVSTPPAKTPPFRESEVSQLKVREFRGHVFKR